MKRGSYVCKANCATLVQLQKLLRKEKQLEDFVDWLLFLGGFDSCIDIDEPESKEYEFELVPLKTKIAPEISHLEKLIDKYCTKGDYDKINAYLFLLKQVNAHIYLSTTLNKTEKKCSK